MFSREYPMSSRLLLRMICAQVVIVILLGWSVVTAAAEIQRYGLTIGRIRAVGDYQGAMHDNTVELWFTAPLNLPGGALCTDNSRAYIDAKHTHMVAMAYQALATKTRVSINLDDSLPVRGGACGISFLDIGGQ